MKRDGAGEAEWHALRVSVLHSLRGFDDHFVQPLTVLGNYCRNGGSRIPLRIAALAMVRHFIQADKHLDADSAYAFACALRNPVAVLAVTMREYERTHESPTPGDLELLVENIDGDSAWFLAKVAQEHPEPSADGFVNNCLTHALPRFNCQAWRSLRTRYAAPGVDDQARVISAALAAYAEGSAGEDWLALDDALARYATDHPDDADIVQILRLAALNIAIDTPSDTDAPSPLELALENHNFRARDIVGLLLDAGATVTPAKLRRYMNGLIFPKVISDVLAACGINLTPAKAAPKRKKRS